MRLSSWISIDVFKHLGPFLAPPGRQAFYFVSAMTTTFVSRTRTVFPAAINPPVQRNPPTCAHVGGGTVRLSQIPSPHLIPWQNPPRGHSAPAYGR